MANVKRDSKGHVLAAWDDHVACRNCLKQMGIFCSRDTPCQVCSSWDEATWLQSLECAIQDKEKQRAKTESSSSEAALQSPLAKKSKSAKLKGEGRGKARQPSAHLPSPSRTPVPASSGNTGSSVKPAHSLSQESGKASPLSGKAKVATVGPAPIPLVKHPDQLEPQ